MNTIGFQILAFPFMFFFMEFVAWAMHKYVMHGPFWFLHKDHHRPHEGFFERNDFFFLLFAIPSALMIYSGVNQGITWLVSGGAGIALYGLCYFLIHDVLIHRRFKWFDHIDHPYLRAIRKAHKVHHKHLDPADGECFGMLIVPMKFYREALQQSRR